jgi:hypothetical protein
LLVSTLLELLGDHVEVTDGLGYGALVFGLHQLLCLHVGEGPSRPDDRLAVASTDDVGLLVDLPDGREGQPIDIGPQRAEILSQQFWQHVCPSVDQIDSGAPVSGLHVQGRVRAHVVAHISNMHADL